MITFLNSKWLVMAILLIVSLLFLFIIGKKSVRTEIYIEASLQEVWIVLTDASRIKEWNGVLVPIEGKLVEGGAVKYEFYQDENGKAALMSAEVKKMVYENLINQVGGIPGILTFNHRYILNKKGEGTTVTILEEYSGIMVPFWNPEPVKIAYERLLTSLKNRVMQLKTKDELSQ